MNDKHVQQIFSHYIERFEMLNDTEHAEYYKWQIVKQFHDQMNMALEAPNETFSERLYELKKLTANLIDSYTQPFYGLVKFAQVEPETVRQMFCMLYRDDGGNMAERQKKVENFLRQSHALRDKYFPDSYLYQDDMHSVTGYLFLYDPDHNYIYKATHARTFADCVEFYDDWGVGDAVNLDVYYRMCNQLVEMIKENEALLLTDASRFADKPDDFYEDNEKHILAFDIIYCCSAYGLFDGITFVRPKSKERQLIQERKEKALELSEKYEVAKKKLQRLEEGKKYINSVYIEGRMLHHKKYGDGVIIANSGKSITVDFVMVGIKKLGTFISAANGIITVEESGYMEKLNDYRTCLKEEDSIMSVAYYIEKDLASYTDYLG